MLNDRCHMNPRLFTLLLIVVPTLSHAKPDCKEVITTPDINQCAQIEFESVEKKLNETYRRVLKSLNKPDEDMVSYSGIKKGLIEAQKAWVSFRQKDCNAYFTLHASGTIRTVMYIGCMQSHAERRIKEISEYEMQ